MAKYTNTGAGARGVNVKPSKDATGTETTWIEPGQTVDIDDTLIVGAVSDDLKKGEAAAKDAAKARADAAADQQAS